MTEGAKGRRPEPGPASATRPLAKAKELLVSQQLDALCVTDLLNIRHLCGFTGSNGLLLVLGDRSLFVTDFRYTLQARDETRGVEVVEAKELEQAASEILNAQGAKTVGVEERCLTVSRWKKLAELCAGMALADAGESLVSLRVSKDAVATRRLREASQLAEAAFRVARERVRPGATEAEVAMAFHAEALRLGAQSLAFDTIVAGGPRGALPHARPGRRRFRKGDLVVFDFGVRLDGYCSDETVTLPVGRVEGEARVVYDVVALAQRAGLAAIQPGVALADVDKAARDVICQAGYGDYFGHGTGHGVGLAVHEAPTVNARSKETAQVGMVFTVEPGVYLPSRFGVRLEDTVRVTRTGHQPITALPKDFGALD